VALAATGAIWTTDSSGNPVNANLYPSKAAVYLNGGPVGGSTNGLPDGNYYCRVLSPSGSVLGFSNTSSIVVSGGVIARHQLVDMLYTASSDFTTKGYDDTDNPGGEYKVETSMSIDFTDRKSDNFKVAPLTVPTIDLEKTVTPASRPEPGGVFDYTITIINTSAVSVTITALTDTNPAGQTAVASYVGLVMTAGQVITVNYSVIYTAAGTYNNTATVTVVDSNQMTASDSDTTTCQVTDVLPTVDIEKSVTPASRPEPGGSFAYTITITNNSVTNVTMTTLTDTNPAGQTALAPYLGDTMAPGQVITVNYSVSHTTPGIYDNTAAVTVTDAQQRTASDSDTARCEITHVGLGVDIEKSVTPASRPEPGGSFAYTITITNNSVTNVTITTLTDTNPAGQTALAPYLGDTMAPGQVIIVNYSVSHTTPGIYDNTAAVTVTDAQQRTASDSDTATSAVTEVAPDIGVTIVKSVTPANRPEPGGSFAFTVTITNGSNVDVEITELTDTNAAGQTAMNSYIGDIMEPGEVITINYSAIHSGVGTYTNTAFVEVTGIEGEGSDSDSDTATCRVYSEQDQPGTLTVVKLTDEGQPLDGATFALYSGSSKLDERTLTGNTYTWSNLDAGTYTVVETSAPDGWVIRDASKSVTISQGEDETVTFYNDPIAMGSITVVKLVRNEADGTTSGLNGVTFALYQPDTDGTLLDQRTLAGNEYTWSNLEPGDYVIVELAAPDRPDGLPFEMADPVPVTVPAGENVRVEVFNSLPLTGTGSITVVKLVLNEVDGTTRGLNGVTFALYKLDTNGVLVDQRTLTGNEYTWSNLEPGDYMVVEVAAPNRPDGTPFEMADPFSVTVTVGENVRVEIFNSLPLTGTNYVPQFFAGLSMLGLGLALRRRRVL
jgi:uncharacterized repeat protein (TIGR01451 family)